LTDLAEFSTRGSEKGEISLIFLIGTTYSWHRHILRYHKQVTRNHSDWCGNLFKDDQRWTYGTPPAGNANYAWVQHFVHRRPGSRMSRGRVTPGLGVA